MKLRTVVLGLAIIMAAASAALYSAYIWFDRTPSELLRYSERRLLGHPKLEAVFVPLIQAARRQLERPVAGLGAPIDWRGARPGAALPLVPGGNSHQQTQAVALAVAVTVGSVSSLIEAIGSARPGDVIEILPGRYRIAGHSIVTRGGGLATGPITVRAGKLGDVVVEFEALEGFHVLHPFWVFENLEIIGVCRDHGDCEHAFHVVGNGHSTVIRNNRIRDFNAHIKVNGTASAYPDLGVIQSNTIFNTTARSTVNPVTPIDIVAANGWQISDNFIADFVKAGGDRISYGAFIKGGGSGGRFERNIIICALTLHKQPGLRVGLSFGNGGTGPSYCRGGRCDYEHDQGVAANNVIAHCNDFGIDVYRSQRITITHNTLINTAGIDVREFPASAVVSNNLLEGRIRQRRGGWVVDSNNWVGSPDRLFRDPDRLDLKWVGQAPEVAAVPSVAHDLCGHPRGAQTPPGALAGPGACIQPGA